MFLTLATFNFNTRRTWQHEQGTTSWGTSRNTYTGRFLRRNSSNFLFGWGQNRSQDFSAGVEYSESENYDGGPAHKRTKYFGDLTYTYEANFGKLKKLDRQYKKFLKTTGIDDVCVEIDRRERGKLKYHRLLHKLKFSQEFIAGFANIESIDQTLDYFKYEIEGVASMMADDGRKEFCKGARRHKRCRKKLTRKAKRAFKKMAKDLRKFVGNEEGINFAKAFSRLAKHIVKEPVLYRLMYEEGKKCGMKATFEIGGEKIARIYKEQSYPVSDYCYLNNL